jgi:hypothetical protein
MSKRRNATEASGSKSLMTKRMKDYVTAKQAAEQQGMTKYETAIRGQTLGLRRQKLSRAEVAALRLRGLY